MNDSLPGDKTLVDKACGGDERAFADLINQHRPLVFGVIWAVLRDADDTEDATQETFILAYRNLNQLDDVGKFSSWLYTIARNVALKWVRKRTLEARGLSRVQEYQQLEFLHPEKVVESQYASDLKLAFKLLSPADRMVTTLFYRVGLHQNQIASILGIPVGTVKSRLHRSRKQLKRRLLVMGNGTLVDQENQEDYGRRVISGMRGVIHWQKLIQGDGLADWRPAKGHTEASLHRVWTRTDDGIVGEAGPSSDNDSPLIIGDSSWGSYELSLLITPISGGNAQVFFRMSEDERCWYLLDFLLGWQAVAISKVTPEGLTKLSVVNYPIEHGQEYDVQIAARGASLTSYIDGKLVNQVTDFSYQSGSIALNVWECKTAFRDLRFRLLH